MLFRLYVSDVMIHGMQWRKETNPDKSTWVIDNKKAGYPDYENIQPCVKT